MNRVVRVVAILAAVVGLFAVPARADEGPGRFTVEVEEPVGDLQVRYVVRETFINDGHPVRDATVTATAVASDGTAGTPAPMTPDGEGAYEAVVTFPSGGAWTVRFTSVEPPATLEHPATVAEPATSAAEASESTSALPELSVPDEASPVEEDNADGGGAPIALLVLGVAAAGIVAFLFLRNRR